MQSLAITQKDVETIALSAAETALACYVVRRGGHQALRWSDEKFDLHRDDLAAGIAGSLEGITAPKRTYGRRLTTDHVDTLQACVANQIEIYVEFLNEERPGACHEYWARSLWELEYAVRALGVEEVFPVWRFGELDTLERMNT